MRYFLWISEKKGDEYCAIYREDQKGKLWRRKDNAWVTSLYANLDELKADSIGYGDQLLEAQ